MAAPPPPPLLHLPPVRPPRPAPPDGRRRLAAGLLVILALVGGTWAWRSRRPADPQAPSLQALGEALCALPEQPAPAPITLSGGARVEVGPALRSTLEARRLALLEGCAVQLRPGDLPAPFGDGAATHHLRLTDGDGGVLAVRVRAPAEGAPRLLGVCTLAPCLSGGD
jgi:hypothetical protein